MLGVFDDSVNLRGRKTEGEKEGLEGRKEEFIIHPLELADSQKVFVCVLPVIVLEWKGRWRPGIQQVRLRHGYKKRTNDFNGLFFEQTGTSVP